MTRRPRRRAWMPADEAELDRLAAEVLAEPARQHASIVIWARWRREWRRRQAAAQGMASAAAEAREGASAISAARPLWTARRPSREKIMPKSI